MTITLSYLDDSIAGGEISEYSKIGLSIMMIGSDFDGSSGTVESSFIYGKMGQLEEVVDDDTRRFAQFDFRNGVADSSPFDYLPTSTIGDNGCGSILKGGKIIIETGTCELSNFYAFITGFVYSGVTDGTSISNHRSIINIDDSTNPNARAQPEFKQPLLDDATDDSKFIFKTSEDDQDVGLWINYMDTGTADEDLSKIQISFVHVGIQDYTGLTLTNPYPLQGAITRDDFTFFSAAVQNLETVITPSFNDLVITNDEAAVGAAGSTFQLGTYMDAENQ